jgi:hypothetical protein
LARPSQGDFVENQQNQNANEEAGVEEAQEKGKNFKLI